MKTNLASLAFVIALLSGPAQAEGQASLDIRVIVPEMVQVYPSDHPVITQAGDNKQVLTIRHNLTRLCLDVSTTNNDPAWRVQVASHNWQVTKQRGGYQLCTTKGTLRLELSHDFGYLRHPWPVRFTVNPV